MIGKAALGGAVLLLWATPAAAQLLPWRDVVFVNISPGTQTGTRSVTSTLTFDLYDETATVTVARDVEASTFIDATVGAALLDNIGAALSFWTRSAASAGNITASIPDPLFTDAPRNVTASLGGFTHKETWIGIQGVYGIGLRPKLDLMLFGGPAVAKVEHDIAGSATVTETEGDPVVNVEKTRLSKSLWGFVAGADVRYMFHELIGVGGFVRFTGASGSIAIPGAPDNTPAFELEVGGFQVGVGVRIRY